MAGIIISVYGDMTAMNEWTQSIVDGENPTEEDIKSMVENYMETNGKLITIATFACVLPAALYGGNRLLQGWKSLKNTTT